MSSIDPAEPKVSLLPQEALRRIAKIRENVALEKPAWRLSLSRLKLTDRDMQEIDFASLSSITALDLSGNLLTQFPRGIMLLPQLQELVLYKNQISLIPDGIFSRLRELHTLLISDNILTSLPRDLAKSPLRVLSLSSNRFASIPYVLSGLTRTLEQVDILANPVKVPEDLLEFLKSLPSVGLLGFGSLLDDSSLADYHFAVATADGVVEEWKLHFCILEREPFFRGKHTCVIESAFSKAAWNMVLQFLYTGTMAIANNRALFDEVVGLVRAFRIESLLHLIERELEERAEEPEEEKFLNVHLDDSLSFGRHIQSLLHNSADSGDFVIECADGVQLKAHRAILSTRLDLFARMMRGQFREYTSSNLKLDFESQSVLSLLEWCYTDAIGILYTAELTSLLELASFLMCNELKVEVESLLSQNIDHGNAPALLQTALFFGETQLLLKEVKAYMKVNWPSCIDRPDWRNLTNAEKDVFIK